MRNKIKVLQISFLLTIAITATVYAKDGVSARSSVDRNSILIGDKVVCKLEISAPRGAEVQMPAFRDGRIGDFEIKDLSSKMDGGLFGKKTLRNKYVVTIYSVGKKEIPEIEIKYKLKGSKDWASTKTAAISVNVRSLLPKDLPPDIKDIKTPASYFEVNWLLVAGLLLLLAASIAGYIFYRKVKERKPVRMPHETALEELEAARAQLARNGDLKEYFVAVSDCIRRYIERLFKLKAPEMTTEEFLHSLRDSASLTIEQKELLKGFMNACDLVKFAKYTPTSSEAENVYATAARFVEETKGVA